MRMSQSLAEIEAAFEQEAELERSLAEARVRQAETRSQRREVAREHRHGTMRFWLLVLVLLGTAVLVTVAMFQTLYLVMG
jgi:ferric-dicitrate binding protein FerR (iron transport regulator)